jgi:hypothetical protein
MAQVICSNCGSTAKPKTKTKGSIIIEFILWCMMLLPGLIYSIWRLTTRAEVCRVCESTGLVPLNSPVGRELTNKYAKA